MFTQSIAGSYYEFAGSSKVKEVKAKQEEMGRAMRKTGENVRGAITQKSEVEQKRFNDKKLISKKSLVFSTIRFSPAMIVDHNQPGNSQMSIAETSRIVAPL